MAVKVTTNLPNSLGLDYDTIYLSFVSCPFGSEEEVKPICFKQAVRTIESNFEVFKNGFLLTWHSGSAREDPLENRLYWKLVPIKHE